MMTVTAPERSQLIDVIEAQFRQEFGAGKVRFFFAPGRINLVGAHLDYSGGDVMPMAVDRGVYVAIRPRTDSRVSLRSVDQPEPIEVELGAIGDHAKGEWGWGSYPLGMVRSFQRDHGLQLGFDAVFGGNLPIASGLSSSAALEVVTAIAIDAIHDTQLSREQIASMAHRSENDFVGVRCGIMDPYASALGKPGHVLWLHCQGPQWEHVPFDPSACEVLVMDTKKPRELAASGFNERVAQCVAAREYLSRQIRELPNLASFSLDEVESCKGEMEEVLFLRARHVASEMGRIAAGVEALRKGDYAGLGAQLNASHGSTATDYDVSCDELDVITEAARSCDGVFGARLTGAGFGGCAIALIRPGLLDQVTAHVGRVFQDRFGVKPSFDLLRVGDGPGEILS